MAVSTDAFDLAVTMKAAIMAMTLGVLLTGCSHERTPYTAVEVTNNPPRAQPAYTNPVPVPTSDRTNSRVYSTNSSPAKP